MFPEEPNKGKHIGWWREGRQKIDAKRDQSTIAYLACDLSAEEADGLTAKEDRGNECT